MTAPQEQEALPPDELFEAHRALIESLCGAVCRRHGCRGADAEDFTQLTMLRLVEDDYARLRRFQGRSQLKTFLRTVVVNLFRDYRRQEWGKWRPSTAARRAGEVAVRLEELLYRDGRDFAEACELLRIHERVDLSVDDLAALAAQLPRRTSRRFEGDEQLDERPGEARADDRLRQRELAATARAARQVLAGVLEGLDPEERLILRLRFEEGFTAARIGALLDVTQRKIYSRLESLRKRLEEAFYDAGLEAEDVLALIGWEGFDSDGLGPLLETGNADPRPSIQEGADPTEEGNTP